MVGLIRGVSEGLGPVGGAAAIYTLGSSPIGLEVKDAAGTSHSALAGAKFHY